MCFCQAGLIHTSLKKQEFDFAHTLALTKPQLESGFLHNIPTKSHMNKHNHMPVHTNIQMGKIETQQNRSCRNGSKNDMAVFFPGFHPI